jgi:14-3-3 protein epsilon
MSQLARRDQLFFKAEVLDQALCHAEMVTTIEEALNLGVRSSLNRQSRDLIATAFRNVVGSRRDSMRILSAMSIQHKGQPTGNAALKYEAKIRKELSDYCKRFLSLAEKQILPLCEGDREPKIFFLKLCGDYCRYEWEVLRPNLEHNRSFWNSGDSHRLEAAGLRYYKQAAELFLDLPNRQFLEPIDEYSRELFSGLILNYSVFLREVGRKEDALLLAQFATNWLSLEPSAMSSTNPSEEHMILTLVGDNTHHWKEEDGGREKADARFNEFCQKANPPYGSCDIGRFLFELVQRG